MRLLSTAPSPIPQRILSHHPHLPLHPPRRRLLTTASSAQQSSPPSPTQTLPSYFSTHRYRTAFYLSTLLLGTLTIYLDHTSSTLRTESALNYHNRLFFEYKTELMLLHVSRLNAQRVPVTVDSFMGEGMEETRRGVESKDVNGNGNGNGKGDVEGEGEGEGESSRARMILAAMSRTGVTHEKAMQKVRRDREEVTAEYERRRVRGAQGGWTKVFNG